MAKRYCLTLLNSPIYPLVYTLPDFVTHASELTPQEKLTTGSPTSKRVG